MLSTEKELVTAGAQMAADDLSSGGLGCSFPAAASLDTVTTLQPNGFNKFKHTVYSFKYGRYI